MSLLHTLLYVLDRVKLIKKEIYKAKRCIYKLCWSLRVILKLVFTNSQIAKGRRNELNMHDKAKVPKRFSFLHMDERRTTRIKNYPFLNKANYNNTEGTNHSLITPTQLINKLIVAVITHKDSFSH